MRFRLNPALEDYVELLTVSRIYDDRIAKDASYPSEIPSVGDSPQYEDVSGRFISPSRQDSPMRWNGGEHKYAKNDIENLRIAFAPPG